MPAGLFQFFAFLERIAHLFSHHTIGEGGRVEHDGLKAAQVDASIVVENRFVGTHVDHFAHDAYFTGVGFLHVVQPALERERKLLEERCVDMTARERMESGLVHFGLMQPTDDAKVIYTAARELFKESYDWNKGVRSIGVRCTKLVRADSGEQLSLFTEIKKEERDDRLNRAIDDINRRYGSNVIKSAAEAESFTKDNKAADIVTDPFHPEDEF